MQQTEGKSKKNSLTSRFVDFIFSKDPRKWLILIFILGLILRFIVASNITPVADEMVHGVHAIGVSKLAPLSTMAQAQVWYYLTDYGYRIFGIHLITARLLSVLFGSLSILIVYLLGSVVFNRKTGIVAAFLLAISPFHITWAASYQDETMMFFILLASYFFISHYKDTKRISLLSAVLLGIAVLVKIIAGVFILVFGVFMLGILFNNFRSDKKLFRINIKKILLFGLIILIALLPIFAYNYFLYKDKGIVDLVFAQFLRINAEFYTGPGLAHGEGFVLHKLPHNLYSVITAYFLKEDPILLFLALGGIVYLISRVKQKNFGEVFLVSTCLFALFFIASAIVLQTHYTSFYPYMALFGAVLITTIYNKFKGGKNSKKVLYALLLIILIFNIYSLREPLTSKSAIEKLRNFADSSIDQNSLVFADSRIYVGTTVWMLNDKHYIDSSYLAEILKVSNAQDAKRVQMKVWFIECVPDDCGWGTIKDQPELNKSVEQIVDAFRNVSTITTITGGGSITRVRGQEVAGVPFFRVYQTTLAIDPRILPSIDKAHSHFLYHIPRNEFPTEAFDYYTVDGALDQGFNFISYATLYLMLFLAFVSIGLPFYLIFTEK